MRIKAASPSGLITSYLSPLEYFLYSTHPINPFFGIKTKKAILR